MKRRVDRQFIRALKRRDERAFTEMVRLYQHKIFHIILRIVGDRQEAEDVAQEVFVAVFKHIDSFRGDAKFSTWLYRIAANRAKNRVKYLARRSHRQHREFEETAQDKMQASNRVPGPDERAQGNELYQIINAGLQTLSEEHRAVVVLRDVEDMSYAEIADALDVAEGTVKSRLYRARAALKAFVEQSYTAEKSPADTLSCRNSSARETTIKPTTNDPSPAHPKPLPPHRAL